MNSNRCGDGGWQVTYAVVVIVSWLPVPIHLAEPALFSACNLVLLVSTGLLQRHLSAQLKRAQRQGYLKFSALLEWIIYQPFKTVAYGISDFLFSCTDPWCFVAHHLSLSPEQTEIVSKIASFEI
jgi:hypothetical protein